MSDIMLAIDNADPVMILLCLLVALVLLAAWRVRSDAP